MLGSSSGREVQACIGHLRRKGYKAKTIKRNICQDIEIAREGFLYLGDSLIRSRRDVSFNTPVTSALERARNPRLDAQHQPTAFRHSDAGTSWRKTAQQALSRESSSTRHLDRIPSVDPAGYRQKTSILRCLRSTSVTVRSLRRHWA